MAEVLREVLPEGRSSRDKGRGAGSSEAVNGGASTAVMLPQGGAGDEASMKGA